MVYSCEVPVSSRIRNEMVDITGAISDAVGKSGIQNGTCLIASLHTTAGITINENADPSVVRDILWKLEALIPADDRFHHREGNSDSHIKASLVGLSVQVPISGSRPVLGRWQGIYFCEFDGPRRRRVSVIVIGE